MANVLVKLYSTLRLKLDRPQVWLEGATVGEVLDKLAARGGPEVRADLFDEKGVVRNHFVLTLDSEILDHNTAGKKPVADGNVLHIFPPISGG